MSSTIVQFQTKQQILKTDINLSYNRFRKRQNKSAQSKYTNLTQNSRKMCKKIIENIQQFKLFYFEPILYRTQEASI